MAKTFNIEDYRIPDADLDQFQRNQKVPERKVIAVKTKRTDAFVMIPLSWTARTGDPHLMVYVDLVYRAWRAKGKPFPMPNIKGVEHHIKNRILRGLERAGLITVERQRRKSPVVTLVVPISHKS